MTTRILYFLISTFCGAVTLACMMVLIPHALWLDAGESSASFGNALRSAMSIMFTFGFPVWLMIVLTADKRGAMSRRGGIVFGSLAGLVAWSIKFSADPSLLWLAAFFLVSGGLGGMLYAGLEMTSFEERDAERREKWLNAPQVS
ncbi:MAG: hypothetical protein AAFY73_12575 [Pseudomonadota bacterium]